MFRRSYLTSAVSRVSVELNEQIKMVRQLREQGVGARGYGPFQKLEPTLKPVTEERGGRYPGLTVLFTSSLSPEG